MASHTPRMLLGREGDRFFVFETNGRSYQYDIVSYRWDKVDSYHCDFIEGIDWTVTNSDKKLKKIQNLMRSQDVQYMWVDSVCINKNDSTQETEEMSKMFHYYKNARKCYLLIDMPELFYPQQIVDDLKFLDHVIYLIGGAAMASDTGRLSPNLADRLDEWAFRRDWAFDLEESIVRSAAIDLGVLNCYATCINHVVSLFENEYFTRVWTFQEMILGKNIEIVGVTDDDISNIGTLGVWMDLATDSMDKAAKISRWIADPRILQTSSISLILRYIQDDIETLTGLQAMVQGISSARIDIINGGQFWWVENQGGVSNIFSAVSLIPRECYNMEDLFRGLLGIFNGLFTPEEIKSEISGNDIEKMSFAFFKRLSSRTGCAWTKLSISSHERGEWDWIPVMEQKHRPTPVVQPAEALEGDDGNQQNKADTKEGENRIKTDIFAGVVNFGRLKKKGRAKTQALTKLLGIPSKYMTITLKEEKPGFHFIFRGCNCGKTLKTGMFKKNEPIPINDRVIDVAGDETGRTLSQCATILGCVLDPGSDVVAYRGKLLRKLAPQWTTSDPNAKPSGWPERCVSGTIYEHPSCQYFLRTHNMSMNYRMGAITGCGSRLSKGSTANISCEVRVNCGCTIIAPFSLIFEALINVEGSSLGAITGEQDDDDRILLIDGLGLVQIGDLGRTFNLVAFGGNVLYHINYASQCRRASRGRAVEPSDSPPTGRALISADFTHGLTDMMRDYGYVYTGAGNLLICREHRLAKYKIRGVCIDNYIPNKNQEGERAVTIC